MTCIGHSTKKRRLSPRRLHFRVYLSLGVYYSRITTRFRKFLRNMFSVPPNPTSSSWSLSTPEQSKSRKQPRHAFRQLLVPTLGSLVSITCNFVLLVRISLQNLGSQFDVNLAIVIQTGAANLEEDGTRTGNFISLVTSLTSSLALASAFLQLARSA